MSALVRVRTAYPFHRSDAAEKRHWACLLECGHTIELDLVAGERPRRLSCPLCSQAPPVDAPPDDFWIDFGH